MSRAEENARLDLEQHALRLLRAAEEQRAGGSRLGALNSLAKSRGVSIIDVVAAADRNELRSIIDMPDVRSWQVQAEIRRAKLAEMRRTWN